MANGVAHHVQQRIHHLFHEKLVDLDVMAGQFQANNFMALTFEAPNDKRHSLEDLSDGHHPHAHDTLAQIAELPLHQQVRILKLTPRRNRHDGLEPAQTGLHMTAADDQAAHHRHEVV